MKNIKVNILGTEWKIVFCKEEESELLKDKCRDGCTDDSARTIWICEKKMIANCRIMKVGRK